MVAPSLTEFLELSPEAVRQIIAPRKLSISLLLNGTRRLYLASHFDVPPTDLSYMADCLDNILFNIARILRMLADYGVYRVFLPSYSEDQEERHPVARKFLLKGLEGLVTYPALLDVYHESRYSVRFYGDMAYLPQPITDQMQDFARVHSRDNDHYVYYGIDGGNPHDFILRVAHEYSMAHGHPPTWNDMLEMYYGDRQLQPLDILVAFNRIYARLGIPPLLDGNDRIYATAISPLVISEKAVKSILYDYLFNIQDRGRDYLDLSVEELKRLKTFYEANQDTVIGLTHNFEGLSYPLPAPVWPQEFRLP